jgi:hypothetical protein
MNKAPDVKGCPVNRTNAILIGEPHLSHPLISSESLKRRNSHFDPRAQANPSALQASDWMRRRAASPATAFGKSKGEKE